MRLNKYLASCLGISRRSAEEIILAKKVTVNGQKTDSLATTVSQTDEIRVDNKIIEPEKLVYYLLNKPKGFTSTRSDKHASHLVTELVPDSPPVYPVGRLDVDTTGLILLTNDGDLTFKLTHPKFKKEKEYEVVIDKQLKDFNIKELEKGLLIDGKITQPAKVKRVSEKVYLITLTEGRNRQVRKMFQSQGAEVLELKRIRIGKIRLGNLKEGSYRKIQKDELEELF